jgi:putative Holliday junction resolvase
MRMLGVDFGRRRIGLAITDASATLARPLQALAAGASDADTVSTLAGEIDRLHAEEELSRIVVGLPLRLDGSPTELTPRVRAFAAMLAGRTSVPVALQDERLTSREAEQRLALTEPDWRKRKTRLDAAAAAVILQDYVDSPPGAAPAGAGDSRGERAT